MLARTKEFLFQSRGKFRFSQGMPAKSFYRRKLPQHLVAFDSHEGKLIFRQGLTQGYCQSFFNWVQQFVTQNQVSTCSSASMAMMLNTLGVDPGVNWKGIWRWYDDYNINHMNPEKIIEGLTLQEFNHLAQLNSARSMAFSPLEGNPQKVPNSIRKTSLEFFRNCVKACTSRSDSLLTVNFHRKTLGQTGTGHYSPLAAFNASKDMVLILDVAKFKYDSYWCRLETLYESFKAIDLYSDLSRGYLINRKVVHFNDHYHNPLHHHVNHRVNTSLSQSISLQQSYQKLYYLLLDKQVHYLLIPVLYDYHTCSLVNLDEDLYQLSKHLGGQEVGWNQAIDNLDQEAMTLLSAFQRNDLQHTLRFLCLFLTELPEDIHGKNHDLSGKIYQLSGFLKYLKKTYLQLKG